uniref:Tubulin/FtsZ GTPase domain-containing protein n=1 Tax=Glossina austeni TaxID=7395 RepID=A0A1A9UZ02_GLOAU
MSEIGPILADEFFGGVDATGTHCNESDLHLEQVNFCCKEMESVKYVPCAILVDSDPGIVGSNQMFKPDNIVLGDSVACNKWTKCHGKEVGKLVDSVLDIIRKEYKNCDYLQDLQLVYFVDASIFGSIDELRMGTLLLAKVSGESPSSKGFGNVAESRNGTLRVYQHTWNTDDAFCIDNEALYEVCVRALKLTIPPYRHLNHLVSATVSAVTKYLRFPGQWNMDLAKLAVNIITLPRFHAFMPGFMLLNSRGMQKCGTVIEPEVTEKIFDAKDMRVDYCSRHCLFLTIAAIFRARICKKGVDGRVPSIQERYRSFCIEWIPRNSETTIWEVPPGARKMSVSIIGNSNIIQELFKGMTEQFTIKEWIKLSSLKQFEKDGKSEAYEDGGADVFHIFNVRVI